MLGENKITRWKTMKKMPLPLKTPPKIPSKLPNVLSV